ncbi:hypothetical protein [Brevibacterium sp. RIT 803]|uniref:hypothetical protein n=1 Tax=Brevibacterium sp. RIT 803 TaxID=2810210 RepID=UPI00194ED1B9|nr:hypothetical protein [Brevibacterium sp. RIT 803]MBM6589859.1 hypothetical protein [Brevibacterium sp. RIT 803]
MNSTINTAQSSVAKATDDLSSARDQLAGALALIGELDKALDSPDPLPKGHGSKVADAQAQAQQLQRLVKRREDSLTEARSTLRAAEHEAWTAKVNTLADQVAAFDRSAFETEFIAKVQPVVDELLQQVYEVKQAETELRSLTSGEVHPTGRVSFTPDSYRDLIIDGDKVHSLAPQHLVKDLGSKIVDSRHQTAVNEALAEQREARAEEQAERAAELKAQREAANVSKWGSTTPPAAVTKTTRDGKVTFLRR